MRYSAIFRKRGLGDYRGRFPDFPNLAVRGSTLEEVHLRAAEALDREIRRVHQEGRPLPSPTSLDAVCDLAYGAEVHDPPPVSVQVAQALSGIEEVRGVSFNVQLVGE